MAHSNRNTLGGKGRARLQRNQRSRMPVQPGARAHDPSEAGPQEAAKAAQGKAGKFR